MSAQISVSTPRTASKKRLIGSRSSAAATTSRAASMPSGNASKAPRRVPSSEIARVSPNALKRASRNARPDQEEPSRAGTRRAAIGLNPRRPQGTSK